MNQWTWYRRQIARNGFWLKNKLFKKIDRTEGNLSEQVKSVEELAQKTHRDIQLLSEESSVFTENYRLLKDKDLSKHIENIPALLLSHDAKKEEDYLKYVKCTLESLDQLLVDVQKDLTISAHLVIDESHVEETTVNQWLAELKVIVESDLNKVKFAYENKTNNKVPKDLKTPEKENLASSLGLKQTCEEQQATITPSLLEKSKSIYIYIKSLQTIDSKIAEMYWHKDITKKEKSDRDKHDLWLACKVAFIFSVFGWAVSFVVHLITSDNCVEQRLSANEHHLLANKQLLEKINHQFTVQEAINNLALSRRSTKNSDQNIISETVKFNEGGIEPLACDDSKEVISELVKQLKDKQNEDNIYLYHFQITATASESIPVSTKFAADNHTFSVLRGEAIKEMIAKESAGQSLGQYSLGVSYKIIEQPKNTAQSAISHCGDNALITKIDVFTKTINALESTKPAWTKVDEKCDAAPGYDRWFN